MSKTRITFTALCAILATLALWSVSPSRATVSPRAITTTVPDLNSKAQVLETYFNDLVKYHKKIAEHNKKSSLTRNEFQGVERDAADLTKRISSFQNAVRGIISELKATSQWNSIDAKLLAGITDPKTRALFQEKSFTERLEEAAHLSDSDNEIGRQLDPIRQKVVGRNSLQIDQGSSDFEPRMVRASYASFRGGFRCAIACIVIGVKELVHGGETPAQFNDPNFTSSRDCFCDNNCGPFIG